jgi:signal recognition particle subunit SEC65
LKVHTIFKNLFDSAMPGVDLLEVTVHYCIGNEVVSLPHQKCIELWKEGKQLAVVGENAVTIDPKIVLPELYPVNLFKNLKPKEFREFCKVLDIADQAKNWIALSDQLGFPLDYTRNIERLNPRSPTEELLLGWEEEPSVVIEKLIVALKEIDQQAALDIMKELELVNSHYL